MSTLPVFHATRVFDAPRSRVWDCWTKPELIAQWFGPKGCTCEIVKQEFRPGGVQHSKMVFNGFTMWGKFVFQEIVPGEKLVWLHSFSDEGGVNLTRHPMSPVWPLELLTTVKFIAEGDKTNIDLTWVPHNATPEEIETFREALDGMQQGWGGSFDQLDEFLKNSA